VPWASTEPGEPPEVKGARSRRRLAGAAMLLAYLGGYLFLSAGGRYLTASHGGEEWSRSWCPRLLAEPYRSPTGRQRTTFTPL